MLFIIALSLCCFIVTWTNTSFECSDFFVDRNCHAKMKQTNLDWLVWSIHRSIHQLLIHSSPGSISRSILKIFPWQTERMNFFQAVTFLLLGSAHAFAPAQVCSHRIIDNTIGDMLGPLWWTRNLWMSCTHQLSVPSCFLLIQIPSNILPSSFQLFPLYQLSFISHQIFQFTHFQPEHFTISPLKHHPTHPIYLHYSFTGNTVLHLAAIHSSIH